MKKLKTKIIGGLILMAFLGGIILSLGADNALNVVNDALGARTPEEIIAEKLQLLQGDYEALTKEIEKVETYLAGLKDKEKMQRGAIIALKDVQGEIEKLEKEKLEGE